MKFNNKMGEEATFPQNDGLNENENEDNVDQDDIDEENEETEEIGDMTPDELEAFNALNHKMDELNSALDSIEQKNDVIYSELLKLLEANREIRQEIESEAGDEPPQSSNN